MVMDYQSVRCKMGDQQMAVTALSSKAMGRHNMYTHYRTRQMSQDGNDGQYRKTKRGDPMDKGRCGIQMEVYTLGDTRMATRLKGRSISCNRMALTHSSMSSVIEGQR
jgi:hypothetical protein